MKKRDITRGVAIGLLFWVLASIIIPRMGQPLEVNAQVLASIPEQIYAAADSTPHEVFYQGYVAISGEPYDGAGYFKFAITNEDGTTVYWSNDGSLDEPTVSVPIDVLEGYFTVLLGDTSLSGMREELSPGVFQAPGRYLKVWFAMSLSGPFEALSPVLIASTPYALNAETLDGQPGSFYRNADQVDGLHADQIASTAAYAGGDQSMNLDLPDTVVRYVTVNALRSGRVIVNASGYGYLPVDTHYIRCSITTGTALDNSSLSIARGASYVPFGMTRGYTVGAGTHRFNLVCDANSNQVVVRDTNITAIYVPGSFGALSSQDTSPATSPIPEGCVDEHEAQCGP